jgi:hypothetical protein
MTSTKTTYTQCLWSRVWQQMLCFVLLHFFPNRYDKNDNECQTLIMRGTFFTIKLKACSTLLSLPVTILDMYIYTSHQSFSSKVSVLLVQTNQHGKYELKRNTTHQYHVKNILVEHGNGCLNRKERRIYVLNASKCV